MKQSYKIPTSIDVSYLETEVALQAKSGVGLRPLPLRVILVWIFGVFFAFFSCVSTAFPMYYLPIPLKILYFVTFLFLIFLFTNRDQGGQSRFTIMKNMTTYMFNKKGRTVRTRSTDNPTAFYSILGVKDIHDKTGMITFRDNTYAYAYRIVGNGSALLFDADKEAIINRVDNFYRKMPEYIRMEYITVKEPQKVIRQKANLKQLFKHLDNNDKDIHKIMQESYQMLDEYVGGEFKSIHQYMLVVANSKEYANKAHTILANEAGNSGLMFSDVEPLYKEDVVHLLHTIYSAD